MARKCTLPTLSFAPLLAPLPGSPAHSHCFFTSCDPTSPLYSRLPQECSCAAEGGRKGEVAPAVSPQFGDAEQAKAWQKLTDLQQHMLGLITAVEDQLSLSDSPKSAPEQQVVAASEQTVAQMHTAVETPQQSEQKEACAVSSEENQQQHGSLMREQRQTHKGDTEIGGDSPHGRITDGEEKEVVTADGGAEATAVAAANEAAAHDAQQVRATHVTSWSRHVVLAVWLICS